MQRVAYFAVLVAFFMLLAGGVGAQEAAPLPHEVLVKLRPGLSSTARDALPGRFGGQALRVFEHIGWMRITLPANLPVADAVLRARGMAELTAAEPSYLVQACAVPNDPRFGTLWGMSKIQAPAAWDSTTGNGSVVVAILDSGANYNHQDLAANMWRNPGEIPGNGIDDDHDGYVDDVYGINAITGSGDPLDDAGHGTHVAGTIGAAGNNSVGVTGVNWNVKLMPLKFLAANGTGSTADAVECYNYLIGMKQRGVNIRAVNNSWSGSGYSQALKDAIDAAGNAGILTVCAAGNGNSSGVGQNIDSVAEYPADYASPSIIAVAASDQNDNLTTFSNYGATHVGLAAPGISIISTYFSSTSAYASMSGTSMATPHVTGAAALLAAKNPALSVAALKAALLNSVDKLPQMTGKVSSGGRLNLAAALAAAGGAAPPPPPPPPPAPTYQPDLMLRANSGTSFIGDNVYNSTMQSVTQPGIANTAAIFQAQMQNDGSGADTFTLTGPASGNGWSIRYFTAVAGGLDITGQVTSTGYRTVTVSPGAALPFRVEITPDATAASSGVAREVLLSAKSKTDATKTDLVKAIVSVSAASTRLTGVSLTIAPPSPAAVNTPVTLVAQASGGAAEYMFTMRHVTWWGSAATTLQPYNPNNMIVWKPTASGMYTLTVYARRAGSTASYDVYKIVSYTAQ